MRFFRLADWLSWQETLHPKAIDLGLDRLRRTLQRLQWRAPTCPVITVGGTNGKGSCVAMLDRILSSAGYRVGTFTSPHVLRYNERIRIDGVEVSDASLVAAFERIDVARNDETLTFFEFNALAALLVFETAGLDAVVLEVGLGGRLDAVNAVDADVALLTTIALDHCEWLGSDLESIGREKAGIFRPGRVAVFGSRVMPASIETQASALGTKLLRLGADFDFERHGRQWSWRGEGGVHIEDLPPPALFGEAQYDNAAAVLQTLSCLRERLPIAREAVTQGLSSVRLSARFQVISGPVTWILDVAHNPAAAKTLAGQLRLSRTAGKTIALCGILGDKDIAGIATELRSSFDEWIVAGLAGARAVEPQVLAARLRDVGANVVGVAPTIETACELAQGRAQRGDRIVAFGSFLTVGPVLEWTQRQARLMP